MKFLVAIFAMLVTTNVFAEDVAPSTTEDTVITKNVSERLSCKDIQARISELSDQDEFDTDTVSEIVRLKAEYRRNCARSAAGRRTSASLHAVEQPSSEPEDVVTEVVDDIVVIVDAAPESTSESQELTLEQELANLDAGLCADGSKPNRFGCCGDEVFKDLGDTVFACCPKGESGVVVATDCFPPIK